VSRSEYFEIEDGEWVAVPARGHKNACCDCDLVHLIDYRIVDGQLEIRVKRDMRSTAALRRHRRKKR